MSDEPELLKTIAAMLTDGLKTKVEPFPATEKEFAGILNELRVLRKEDFVSRLIISGFIDHPYGPEKWRCQECIYYLVNRKWCDLPEVSLPAEPDWYCRLWRI